MNNKTLSERLIELSACRLSKEWVASPENKGKPPKELWEICGKGDWLMWIAARVNVPRFLVTKAACDCARLALQYGGGGTDDSARTCIETTEAFTEGLATYEDVIVAAQAVYDARSAFVGVVGPVNDGCKAYLGRFRSAEYAARYPAVAADSGAAQMTCAADYACGVISEAADVAYYAARENGWNAAQAIRNEALAECANLVRTRISWDIIESALEGIDNGA